MIAPTRNEHKNVAPFDDAFDACICPTCLILLEWEPPEGSPLKDDSSEQPVEVWTALCVPCGVTYRLTRFMQRPSDHSLWYGYVSRIDDGDEDGRTDA